MLKHRPINLNLFTIRMPVTAFVSIGHRLSGLLIFFLVPILLYGLGVSLQTASDFNDLIHCASQPFWKGTLWVLGMGLLWHLLAGLKHLLMDCHIGETRKTAVLFSWILIILFIALAGSSACALWWR